MGLLILELLWAALIRGGGGGWLVLIRGRCVLYWGRCLIKALKYVELILSYCGNILKHIVYSIIFISNDIIPDSSFSECFRPFLKLYKVVFILILGTLKSQTFAGLNFREWVELKYFAGMTWLVWGSTCQPHAAGAIATRPQAHKSNFSTLFKS